MPWQNFVLAALACAVLAPNALAQPRRVWVPPEPTLLENVVTALVHVGVYFWVFVLGSVIGSFLNVVAYRLPLGRPLFWPPSSCPACGQRIAVRDNVPVLGWVLLKGRCRNCQQPISPRYPIVEAIVGGLFVLLAAVELFTGGANLPVRDTDSPSGVVSTLLFLKPLLIAQYLFHAAWLSTLVAVVLIDLDRQPVPARKVLGWMGTLALIAVAVEPRLLPVKAAPPGWANERIEAVAQSALGMAAGLVIGYVRERRLGGPIGVVLALTGSALGWQAVVATLLLGVATALLGVVGCRIAAKTPTFSPPPFSLWVAIGGFLHLLFWRPWAGVEQLPGPATPWWVWLVYLALLLIS